MQRGQYEADHQQQQAEAADQVAAGAVEQVFEKFGFEKYQNQEAGIDDTQTEHEQRGKDAPLPDVGAGRRWLGAFGGDIFMHVILFLANAGCSDDSKTVPK